MCIYIYIYIHIYIYNIHMHIYIHTIKVSYAINRIHEIAFRPYLSTQIKQPLP